jgi:hypothetical protein
MKDRVKRRKFSRNYRPEFLFGKLTVTFLFIISVFALSSLFLVQSNRMALKGYDIAKLEKEKQQLLEQQEKLQVELSGLQSISEIEKGIKSSGMVPISKINYLPYSSNIALNSN